MDKQGLRLEFSQASANYRKEESFLNKMTYPLPPFSTIIGAIHNACGYTKYHDMDVSVQGNYGYMAKKLYTSNIFLNRAEDDRGTLVRFKNKNIIGKNYELIAEAKKQGTKFSKDTNIKIVHNEKLLDEYIKDKENKKTQEYCNLVTSPFYYEILYDINLIIHIHASEDILKDIYDHRYDITSIGRSEDFVTLKNAKKVTLSKELDDKKYKKHLNMYISYGAIKEKNININVKAGVGKVCTRYYINKKYEVEEGKRNFEKKCVVYTSDYDVKSLKNEDLYIDDDNYVVNLF